MLHFFIIIKFSLRLILPSLIVVSKADKRMQENCSALIQYKLTLRPENSFALKDYIPQFMVSLSQCSVEWIANLKVSLSLPAHRVLKT